MIQIQKKNGLSIIINNFNKTNEVKRQSEDKIDVPLKYLIALEPKPQPDSKEREDKVNA